MPGKKNELDDALEKIYSTGLPEEFIDIAHERIMKTVKEVLPPICYYGLLHNTPVGDIWIAAGSKGLIAIDFDISEEGFCQLVQKNLKVRLLPDEKQIKQELLMIKDYLNGSIDRISLKTDLRGVSPFQKTVLSATQQIPRGQVATYSEIAQRIGKPKACRAVGQALRYNPTPIVIPCHRVVNSDGTLGGYGGKMGSRRKIKLLQIEGVILT